MISLSLHGCCIMCVYYMCDFLGNSEPVSQVDSEDVTQTLDAVPPSVGQIPQGKRHGRLGQLSHIAFTHIPAFEHVHSIVKSSMFVVNSKEFPSDI